MHHLDNEILAPARAYWNTLAREAPEGCRDHWVDDKGQPLPECLYSQVAEYVIKQLPQAVGDNPKILEIGCGTGRILAALQVKLPSACLWGIDVAEEQIRDARTRLKSTQLESQDLLGFVKEKGQGMMGGYDLIFAHSVTQYFPSAEYFSEVLNEATKLLRPEGCLCLVDVPIDWYFEQMRGQPKATLLTPFKSFIKRILRYKPRPRSEVYRTVETLNGKSIEVPVFEGYWANPEFIEKFAHQHYSNYFMEYQPFSAKPIGYRKYRPIFLMRGKLKRDAK